MSQQSTACSPLSVVPAWRFSRERARTEFKALETWLFSTETMSLPLDEIEREQEKRGREVHRLMLQAHIQARGTGDVGPAIELAPTEGGQGIRLGERREHECHQTTIFGEVAVNRLGYSRAGHPAIHPLDEELALPEDSFSYEIQRRAIKAAVQGPFDEAIERVEESTGVAIPKRSAERIVQGNAPELRSSGRAKNLDLRREVTLYLVLIPSLERKRGPLRLHDPRVGARKSAPSHHA